MLFGNVLVKGRRQVPGYRDGRCQQFMLRFLRNKDVANFALENVQMEC